MIRHHPLAHHLLKGFAALAVAFTVAGCSSTPSTGGGFNGPDQGPGQPSTGNGSPTPGTTPGGGTPTTMNGNSPGGSSGGSSSGSTKPSSSGSSGSSGGGSSSGSTGSSSGSGGGSADAGSGGSSGGPTRLGSTAGCGQGTSCTPGNDLPVPAASDGVQIATPDGQITVQPGQESFLCYYKTLPNTSTVNIGAFQSWMTPGSSHHFIAYQQGGGGPFGGTLQADGTLVSCGFGGGTWVYATSLPGTIVELQFPPNVGLPFASGSQIMLNMHFINPGTTPATPAVKMNMLYAQNIMYTAASMTSFNAQINVPPATGGVPGTQTVSGTCTAAVGSNFFVVTSHTHKHATLAEVNYVSNGTTTNLVHTTDWEHPDARMWTAPNFLTIQNGDSFTYSCSYSNDGSTAVTVGETAANNEMCMAIAYYYPAGTTLCQ